MPATNLEETNSSNIASFLPKMAKLHPHGKAVLTPSFKDPHGRTSYVHLTFRQLEEESNQIANGFRHLGLKKGMKCIVMVRPSLDLFVLTFALFKLGAIPVMIDAGMGLKRMLHCLKETEAEAFVGIPLAHLVRLTHPLYFQSVRIHATAGKRWFWGGRSLDEMRATESMDFEMEATAPDDMAAILFTTGSTGPAKGVVYKHRTFERQVRYLKEHFSIREGEMDLSTFPLFALFGPALGMTSIIPDMDPSRPAQADPAKLIRTIQDQGATTMFGSPALLDNLSRYGEKRGIRLTSLKRVISAGAPVPSHVLRRLSQMLPEEALIHTPYGATEALPVASINHKEILRETSKLTDQGKGICVGYPMKELELKIIPISDEPIEDLSKLTFLPQGKIGEVIVAGENVTELYYNRPEDTEKSKIKGKQRLFHRMGDVGYLDDKGRLWFCGRKAHRVQTSEGTLFTIPCEAIFNTHPQVFRSALVGVGQAPNERPVILIELEKDDPPDDLDALQKELLDLAQQFEVTKNIKTLLFHPKFPVDIRHNAKIFREKLKIWATKHLKNSDQ